MKKSSDVRIIAPLGMSKAAREIAIEQVAVRLYRWYTDQSQSKRNWSPYRNFALSEICQSHTHDTISIVKGFYAVEQYVPDYTSKITHLTRRSYGREHFQTRWGSEEDKHSELWRLALRFSGSMSEQQLTEYTDQLRGKEWDLPWESLLHVLMYTVVQEWATKISYQNFHRYLGQSDPVLSEMTRTITIDEVHHHNFFNRLAAVNLYFNPVEAGQALCDVLRHFSMPAADIIPNYQAFGRLLEEGGIYTRETVVELRSKVLEGMGVSKLKMFERGIAASREAPDPDGSMRSGAFLNGCFNQQVIVSLVASMITQIKNFEDETHISDVDPLSQYLLTESS